MSQALQAEVARLGRELFALQTEVAKLQREVASLRKATVIEIDGKQVPLAEVVAVVNEAQGVRMRVREAEPARIEVVDAVSGDTRTSGGVR